MTYYLLDHPNPNCPDRGDGKYWGYQAMPVPPFLISVHTTESFADQLGEDTGAEAVAAYFTRTDEKSAASYHTIVDSDSTVRCLPAGLDGTTVHTAFHCYGRNTANLGVSFAMRATEWPTVDPTWATKALNRAADEVALWCRRWDIPARRVDRAQADAGVAGITGHGLLQDDRTDPGASQVFDPSLFPWDRFLGMVNDRLNATDGGTNETEEYELRACKMNDGQILLVDGREFEVLSETRTWDEINAILIELGRAGLIPTSDGGVPVIDPIGDNAVNMLRRVG